MWFLWLYGLICDVLQIMGDAVVVVNVADEGNEVVSLSVNIEKIPQVLPDFREE